MEFEVEKVYYEESTQRGTNLSYSFYVTLGIFLSVIGFGDKLNINRNVIGPIFLLLLISLAKVSRLQADNGDLQKRFREKYSKHIIFRGTGIKGVGDFFHYVVLIAITSFFILKPFKVSIPNHLCFVSVYVALFFLLLFIIYYVLARGDFLFGESPLSKNESFQQFFVGAVVMFLIIYGIYFFLHI